MQSRGGKPCGFHTRQHDTAFKAPNLVQCLLNNDLGEECSSIIAAYQLPSIFSLREPPCKGIVLHQSHRQGLFQAPNNRRKVQIGRKMEPYVSRWCRIKSPRKYNPTRLYPIANSQICARDE
ncbi:hypothetical protein KC19_11G149400 [Ceratodon purpureus]|uniref:Uncharacterized protein n=1 Tax=Ceratodon purpureus TaxID=3225 RepID=A0A8T0GGL6_CERPU|nr:hypothetical protein KC19_11G149400 [Ceratodon purpureus]